MGCGPPQDPGHVPGSISTPFWRWLEAHSVCQRSSRNAARSTRLARSSPGAGRSPARPRSTAAPMASARLGTVARGRSGQLASITVPDRSGTASIAACHHPSCAIGIHALLHCHGSVSVLSQTICSMILAEPMSGPQSIAGHHSRPTCPSCERNSTSSSAGSGIGETAALNAASPSSSIGPRRSLQSAGARAGSSSSTRRRVSAIRAPRSSMLRFTHQAVDRDSPC